MGYKNTYTLRERDKERVTKTRGPLGYKNKERKKERETERELQKQGDSPRLQNGLQKLKHHILVLVKIEPPIRYQISQHGI